MTETVEHFEIAIIGAGPAGIGAATSAAKKGLSHILFERNQIANTIFDYQKNKHVMAEPTRLPLRSECRFEAGSREEILKTFHEDLDRHKVNLRQVEIAKVEKTGEQFTISWKDGQCTATHVVLAIGVQGTPRKLGVPGDDLPHVTYTLSDPAAFKGKHIVVVGGGDAGIENALALAQRNTVSLINRGAEFARAKEANARLITEAITNGQIRCYHSSSAGKIDSDSMVIATPNGDVTTRCEHIIARLGCILPRGFLQGMGVEFPNADPDSVPVVNSRYESNVPGLHILGALIGYPLIKQAINQGYEVIEHILGNPIQPADQQLLEERFEGVPGGFVQNYQKLKDNLSLFRDLSEPQMRELVIDSTVHVVKKGKTIFERNDYTDSFWSVVSGSVAIDLGGDGTDPKRAKKEIVLNQGVFFGEMGLITGRRRTATVFSHESGTFLLETPRRQIVKLMSSVVSVKETIDQTFVLRALETSIFPEVPRIVLADLAKRVEMKTFRKGEVLFREGDPGDALYVIRKGSVKISRKNAEKKDVVQTYIPAGNFVGEMALIEQADVPRSATVVAAVTCETIVIRKEDFQNLLQTLPDARARIQRQADERRVENVISDWSEYSGSMLDFMMQQGLSDAENVLVIDSDLCVGCDNCEAACAATHSGYSRLDRKGGKSFAAIQVPISCRHCENPLCMLDCPPDALFRQTDGEVIIRDSCIGCGNCASNCPYGVIQLVYDKPNPVFSLLELLRLKKHEKGPAKAAKCDMCTNLSGGPACVRACPTGAAMRVNPSKLVSIVQSKGI